MNDILRDLINTEVMSFINDVLINMEEEEEHNKVVEEILKKIKENDLYIKLEKYMQKLRRVNFLGVELELEGVKIEKEKVKEVVD